MVQYYGNFTVHYKHISEKPSLTIDDIGNNEWDGIYSIILKLLRANMMHVRVLRNPYGQVHASKL